MRYYIGKLRILQSRVRCWCVKCVKHDESVIELIKVTTIIAYHSNPSIIVQLRMTYELFGFIKI